MMMVVRVQKTEQQVSEVSQECHTLKSMLHSKINQRCKFVKLCVVYHTFYVYLHLL